MFDMPIGDHRNLVVEVRSADAVVATATWDGAAWVYAQGEKRGQELPFRPAQHRFPADPSTQTRQAVEDPDVRQAIADFTPSVIEIRRLSLLAVQNARNPERAAEIRSDIEERVAGLELRADRLGVSIDDLFRLINDALRERRGIDSYKPAGDFLRGLIEENERAYAEEAQLHRERTALDRRIIAATDARLAADRACAGYVAGWAVGGHRS